MDEKILSRLRKVSAELEAILSELEATNPPKEKTARLCLVRQLAILTLVFKAGGEVVPAEISKFAQSVGRTPGSVSGFYAGSDPLMSRSDESDKYRALTERGKKLVKEHLAIWGDNWLDKLFADPVFDKVKDPAVSANISIQIP